MEKEKKEEKKLVVTHPIYIGGDGREFSFQGLCSPQEVSASLADQFKNKLNLSERLINYAIGQKGLKEIQEKIKGFGSYVVELKEKVNLSEAYRACYIKENGEPEWKFNPMPMLTGALKSEEKLYYITLDITGQHPQFFTFKMNVKKWIENSRCLNLKYFAKVISTEREIKPSDQLQEQMDKWKRNWEGEKDEKSRELYNLTNQMQMEMAFLKKLGWKDEEIDAKYEKAKKEIIAKYENETKPNQQKKSIKAEEVEH